TDSLRAYIERKFFTLNCEHAMVAYLGFVHGLSRVDQALANEAVFKDVHGALRESGAGLVSKHGFDAEAHERYVERVLARIANPKLHDDVVRVGRQPLRKLAKGDRLLGPMVTAQILQKLAPISERQHNCNVAPGKVISAAMPVII
ncbi:mannitol dehydrogenase C-terminal domain-containing protein, partial [Lactifluus volemus]